MSNHLHLIASAKNHDLSDILRGLQKIYQQTNRQGYSK